MVRTRFVCLVFACAVAGSAAAQPAPAGGLRVGIGAAVSSSPALLVPIDIGSRLRVEPELSITRSSSTQQSNVVPLVVAGIPVGSSSLMQELTLTGVTAGAGVFFAPSHDKIKMQYGFKVGYSHTSTKSTTSFPGATTTTSDTHLSGYFIGPAIGGEYFLADRFSLGAELQARYTSLDGTQQSTPIIFQSTVVIGGVPTPSTSIVPSPTTNTSQSSFATRASVVARLYFR